MPRFAALSTRFFISLMLAACGWSTGAQAANGSGLYAAQIPISAQTPDELKRGEAEGLAAVLVNVSGRADAAAQLGLRDALANPERYVEQYRYERGADGAITLWLQFTAAPIDALLRSTGVSAASGAENQVYSLQVSGVVSFADYAQLLDYLARLNTVRSMQPQQIEADQVTVSFRLAGSFDQLVNQLAQDGLLLADTVVGAAAPGELRYRWQRRSE